MFLGLCAQVVGSKVLGSYVPIPLPSSSMVLCSLYPENKGPVDVKLERKNGSQTGPKVNGSACNFTVRACVLFG